MTIELPGWLEAVAELVGGEFPEADEEALRRLAEAYRQAAEGLADVTTDGDRGAAEALSALEGEIATKFGEAWKGIAHGDESALAKLQKSCEALGQACDDTALDVEYTKLTVILSLVALVAQLAVMAGLAFFTAGASTAAGAAATAATRSVVMRALQTLLTRITTRAGLQVLGKHLAFNLAIEMGTSLGIDAGTQAYQMSTGERKDFDGGKFGQAAVQGAVGGVVGGVFEAGGEAAAKKMFGGAMGRTAGETAGEAVGETAGNAASAASAAGRIAGRGLAEGASGAGEGAVGGIIDEAQNAAKGQGFDWGNVGKQAAGGAVAGGVMGGVTGGAGELGALRNSGGIDTDIANAGNAAGEASSAAESASSAGPSASTSDIGAGTPENSAVSSDGGSAALGDPEPGAPASSVSQGTAAPPAPPASGESSTGGAPNVGGGSHAGGQQQGSSQSAQPGAAPAGGMAGAPTSGGAGPATGATGGAAAAASGAGMRGAVGGTVGTPTSGSAPSSGLGSSAPSGGAAPSAPSTPSTPGTASTPGNPGAPSTPGTSSTPGPSAPGTPSSPAPGSSTPGTSAAPGTDLGTSGVAQGTGGPNRQSMRGNSQQPGSTPEEPGERVGGPHTPPDRTAPAPQSALDVGIGDRNTGRHRTFMGSLDTPVADRPTTAGARGSAETDHRASARDTTPSGRGGGIFDRLTGSTQEREPVGAGTREIAASSVPGSSFHGHGVPEALPERAQRLTEMGRRALPEVAEGHGDLLIEPQEDGTHRVADAHGQFTVDVRATRHPDDAAARSTLDHENGRHIIELSDRLSPEHVERAVAHELGEIVEERHQQLTGERVPHDALRPGEFEEGSKLSPHDVGRIQELRVLAEQHQLLEPGDTAGRAPLCREGLALAEHLGLRDETPGAAERRTLVNKRLSDTARAHVDRFLEDAGAPAHGIRSGIDPNLPERSVNAARQAAALTRTDTGDVATDEVADLLNGLPSLPDDSPASIRALAATVFDGDVALEPIGGRDGRVRTERPVYRVMVDGEPVGVVEVMPDGTEFARELSAADRLHQAELTGFGAPDVLAVASVPGPDGARRGALFSALSPGDSVDGLLRRVHLAWDRARALDDLRQGVTGVAEGMAELHRGSDRPASPDYLTPHADAIRGHLAELDARRPTLERLGMDLDQIRTAMDSTIADAIADPGPASLAHGDAHLSNFLWDADAGVTLIDAPTLHQSMNAAGDPIGTPARDVTLFTQRIGHFGFEFGLSPAEITQLRRDFADAYTRNGGPAVPPPVRAMFDARAATHRLTRAVTRLENHPDPRRSADVGAATAALQDALNLENTAATELANGFAGELPGTPEFRRAWTAIDNFRSYMLNTADPAIRARFESEYADRISDLQSRQTEGFKALWKRLFPSKKDEFALSPERSRRAEGLIRSSVADAENLMNELAGFAATTGEPALAEGNVASTIDLEGTAAWEASFREAQATINNVIAGFTYRGHPIGYIGSMQTGWRGAHKGKTRFDPYDFDVDLYVVVDRETFDEIAATYPGLDGDDTKIMPDDEEPEDLVELSEQIGQALKTAFPHVRGIEESVIALRAKQPW